jgi:hypothetical protein
MLQGMDSGGHTAVHVFYLEDKMNFKGGVLLSTLILIIGWPIINEGRGGAYGMSEGES